MCCSTSLTAPIQLQPAVSLLSEAYFWLSVYNDAHSGTQLYRFWVITDDWCCGPPYLPTSGLSSSSRACFSLQCQSGLDIIGGQIGRYVAQRIERLISGLNVQIFGQEAQRKLTTDSSHSCYQDQLQSYHHALGSLQLVFVYLGVYWVKYRWFIHSW